MNARLSAAVALLAASSVALVPAHAATKKKPKPPPIKKSFSMQLAPVPDPPQGTSCTRAELEGISMHSESFKTKGAGTLTAKVNGFAGDWDITVVDGSDNSVMEVGSGTTTGGGAPSTKGEDTVSFKVKKATSFVVRYCNFAGSPQATGSYVFTYK
jgi:hypothetical protein